MWFADPTGHPDQGSVQVWTWSGAPPEAQYLIQEPLDIERVQVGGRDAFYGTDGAGNPMSVWWTRADGLVVSVSQTGVLDEAGLIAFAESLQPVDAAGLGAFASAGGFAVVAPTP